MDRKYLKIGTYVPETEDKEAVIQREYYRQDPHTGQAHTSPAISYIFSHTGQYPHPSSRYCSSTHVSGHCQSSYVPELSDGGYTRQDFMALCNGQEDFAAASPGRPRPNPAYSTATASGGSAAAAGTGWGSRPDAPRYLKVGTYVPETEENEAVIQREYYRQGWIFKDTKPVRSFQTTGSTKPNSAMERFSFS